MLIALIQKYVVKKNMIFMPKYKVLTAACLLFASLSAIADTISTVAIGHPPETSSSVVLPNALPSPSENGSLPTAELSTPEYVIIKPSDEATFSSETAASVDSISVKEGSNFKMGDILLKLDCRLQEAELKKTIAQQTQTAIAKKSAIKLKSYGAISEYEVTKATSEAEMANADVDKLHAIVDKCTIIAPFNGSVAELMVHAHESVKPGDPLLKIINTENLEFEIQIPSAWLKWLHIGSTFTVHLNENNKTVTAKITKINPQIESISQSVKIIGIITPPDPDLLPGMSGQANFPDNPTKHI